MATARLDPGTLCIASAYGDHRWPVARNLYVVLGEATDPPRAYQCRPINRNGAHHRDKVLRHSELEPISGFAVRIRSFDRITRLLVLEPDPGGRHTATCTHSDTKRLWHVECLGLGWLTHVDPEAIDYIADPQPAPQGGKNP